MTIPVVQAVGTPNHGVGAVTYAIPAHQADDLLFLFVECSDSVGVTAPSGWAHITNSPRAQGANVTCNNTMWRRATDGSTTDPSVAGTVNHQVGFVVVVRGGVTTGNPWDFSPVGDGTAGATSQSADGGTTTVADCLVMVGVADNQDTVTNQFSNVANASLSSVTLQQQSFTTDSNGGGIVVITGGKAVAGATGDTTMQTALSCSWSALTFAVKPAPSGTPATVNPPAGAAVAASTSPAVSGASTVAPPAGAASATVHAPTVAGAVNVAPPSAAAVAAATSPAVTGLGTIVAPSMAATAAATPPAITAPSGLSPPAGAAVASATAPTVGGAAQITPPAAAATAAATAPSVEGGTSVPADVSAPAAAATASASAPAVTAAATITPPAGDADAASTAPSVGGGLNVTPPAGTATADATAPVIGVGAGISPPAAAATATATPPAVTAFNPRDIQVFAEALTAYEARAVCAAFEAVALTPDDATAETLLFDAVAASTYEAEALP